jgi:hypothetical protein
MEGHSISWLGIVDIFKFPVGITNLFTLSKVIYKFIEFLTKSLVAFFTATSEDNPKINSDLK